MSSLDWTDAITRLIALNTFTSVWYWLAVVVTWAVASNWLIGVPFDVLLRARKCAPQPLADLEGLVDINVRRIVATNATFGLALTGLIGFALTVLGVLSFFYRLELAQGIFILAAPLTLVVIINMRLAHQLHDAPLHGADLVRRLFVVRVWTQVVAMISLFFTAMYGMYMAISASVFF
ncbi:hypothetical protein MWU60_02925 [Yoonia sp. F2084L]|uniref:hypothetical protein n=1 Tax=Yoonia sp. F2084L TaxID=2926419 RepID=UPI001FF56C6C|nr:hypothetical protein [Yoonia sp. F2084L]MCK0094513.1 hypothetical protein [Yoonia sp. F2084L]